MIASKIRIALYRVWGNLYPFLLKFLYGIDLGEGVSVARTARFDTNINPKGIHIGSYTRITSCVSILAHDACRGMVADTYIGSNCFIGIKSIIMPGVHIGNQVVIGGGERSD